MALVLEKEILSPGDVNQIRRQVDRVLEVVPPTATVALEGVPIYLDRYWDRTHELGYNYILAFAEQNLLERGHNFTHDVLLDDYTVEPSIDPKNYLSRIRPAVNRVVWEGDFVPQAEALIAEIGSRRVTRSDGRGVVLITYSGRVSCALLDAAFQETKLVDFNIVIHPIEFSNEQDETRAILFAARKKLPSTFINIFFKDRAINKVYITEPQEGKRPDERRSRRVL